MAYITGRTKFETLVGGSGDDTFDGLGGSDLYVDKYNSNDTYIFNYGYRQPNITDYGGNDTILFGPGIYAQDIKFYITRNGYLMPRIKDTIDKPEITKWPDSRFQIENWKFQDGTVLTNKQVSDLIDYSTRVMIYSTGKDNVTLGGTKNLVYLQQGSDTFTSLSGNNIVEASSGNDKLYFKGNGNDEIYMGPGTDYTEDHGGNDRYIFNKDDGQDTLWDWGGNDVVKFGRGIDAGDLKFNKSGNDLLVSFKDTSDRLLIKDWVKSSSYRIEKLELWDGQTISASTINSKIGISGASSKAVNTDTNVSNINLKPTITGTSKSEYSGGNYGNDVYYMQKGNDKIMDYRGNDTYMFNQGDGLDTIKDQNGQDAIIFGHGIKADDLSFSKIGNNLMINIDHSSDSITVTDWFRNSVYEIESIKFTDDSTVLDHSNINHSLGH